MTDLEKAYAAKRLIVDRLDAITEHGTYDDLKPGQILFRFRDLIEMVFEQTCQIPPGNCGTMSCDQD